MAHTSTGKPEDPLKIPYDVIRVKSWEEFEDLIRGGRFSNWAFRGQQDARWPLWSKLSRTFQSFSIHQQAWQPQEERILRIFIRKAHHFLTHLPEQHDEFQWLALMQHHGAPTRLLDLTWSPYVAAFFALESATSDAAVWALNAPGIGNARPPAASSGKTALPDRIRAWDTGDFHKYCLGPDAPIVLIAEPYVMNRRLIAQSGTFAIPGTVAQPVESILAGYADAKNLLAKLVIPTQEIRDKGMRELYRMNITHATLFPDLDGLARSLAYELEYHWAFDPKTMIRRPGF